MECELLCMQLSPYLLGRESGNETNSRVECVSTAHHVSRSKNTNPPIHAKVLAQGCNGVAYPLQKILNSKAKH